MKCPKCEAESKSEVLETREVRGVIYRRRKCFACSQRFVSEELPFEDGEIPEIRSRGKNAKSAQTPVEIEQCSAR